ncbi:PleD family two-component system response regulator [Candidatus Margulisiibacteriota bacterium]
MPKILLINDSFAISALIKTRLEYGGFAVETAPNGTEGIEAAKKAEYDLIILDYSLPDINGVEVCRVLKKDDDTKDIPVIFISATNRDELIKEIKNTGAVGNLDVPSDQNEFIDKINYVIKNKEL